MSYLVLARKYRPQTFAALVGQDAIVRTLRNAMALGRVHHAFVLAGSRGVGKTSTARLLAKGLNCAQGPTCEPCDDCPSCTGIIAGNAPAVIEVDGASNTGVDHIRELRESARYRPSHGTWKIYIIDEVHMLSQSAFNALLKLLEEPPEHVKFIFATTEPHKIPATILSRCQRFDFRRVRTEVLVAHLQEIARREQLSVTPGALLTLSRDAQGSVRDALSLFDQAIGFAGDAPVDEQVLADMGAIDSALMFAMLDAILVRDADALLALVHTIDVQGHDFAEVSRLLLLHLRDVALAQALSRDGAALAAALERTPEQRERLSAQAALRGQEDWQRAFDKAATIAEATAKSPVPKATFEMGLLRLMQIAPAADVGRLLARIDSYMAQLPVGPADGNTVAPVADVPTALTRSPAGTVIAAVPKPSPTTTPTPVAAPVAAPLQASADVHDAWRQFVDRVRKQRPSVASLLEHGEVITFCPGQARVAFAPGSFCLDALRDADTRGLLDAALGDFGGQPARFEAVAQASGAGSGRTLAEQRAAEAKTAWNETEQHARRHAGIRSAVDILGATVRSIEPASA